MEGTVYRPLFDIDSIIDIPLSVARLIREEYWSGKYFIKLDDEKFLRCLFATIPTRNPIKYLATDKYIDRMGDDIYEELKNDPKLEKYYALYDVGNLINIFNASGFTKSTVLFENDKDVKFIKALYNNNVEVLVTDQLVDISGRYGMYYTSNIYNLLNRIVDPRFVNFRILDLKCNMEKKTGMEMFKLDVISKISNSNTIASIKPYNDLKIPEEG